jgi:hypothetical protein
MDGFLVQSLYLISHVKMRLRVIADRCGRAIAWTYSNAASFDAIRSGSRLAVIPPGGTSVASRW